MATATNILPSEIIKKPNDNYYLYDRYERHDKYDFKVKLVRTYLLNTNMYIIVFTDKYNDNVWLEYNESTKLYDAYWMSTKTQDWKYKIAFDCFSRLMQEVNLIMCENYKLIVMLIYNKYLSDNNISINSNKVLGNKHLMRHIASYL